MNKLTYENNKLYTLIFIMIAIPAIKLLSYILYLTKIINNSFLVNQVYVLWAVIPLLIALYLYGIIKKNYKINYLDYIIYFLILLALISTIFSININVSIFGEETRYEGLLSILSYYLIFLNAKNIKDTKSKTKILNIFLYLGIFQVIYAIIQIYTPFNIVKRYSINYLAMGLCGNPNFLGSYMSMLVIISSYLFIKNNDNKYLILIIIYNIGLTLAQSTGPFLGVVLTIIFMMIYMHKDKLIKKFITIISILLISFLVTNITSVAMQEQVFHNKVNAQYNIGKEIIDTLDIIFHFTDRNKNTTPKRLGNGRVEIWLNLLPKTKEYYLTGSGLDTIKYIYPQNNEYIVDKAHNVYLQILLTNGLFALLTYLSLCFIIFIKGLKDNNIDKLYYLVFIVYSLQAFFNISVIDVAPYFFLFMGFAISNSKDNK